jgi:hypothetical protein
MAEYIEREAADNFLDEYIIDHPLFTDRDAARALKERIKAIPAADVVPVRHGRWIEVGVDKDDDGIPMLIMFGCDQCRSVSWTATPFCGYCGAKMDGEA